MFRCPVHNLRSLDPATQTCPVCEERGMKVITCERDKVDWVASTLTEDDHYNNPVDLRRGGRDGASR